MAKTYISASQKEIMIEELVKLLLIGGFTHNGMHGILNKAEKKKNENIPGASYFWADMNDRTFRTYVKNAKCIIEKQTEKKLDYIINRSIRRKDDYHAKLYSQGKYSACSVEDDKLVKLVSPKESDSSGGNGVSISIDWGEDESTD